MDAMIDALLADRITAGGFRWRSEVSHDGGATWALDEQMLATRR